MPSGRAADTSAGKGWVAATMGPGSAGCATGITTGPEQAEAKVARVRAAKVLCVMANMGLTFIKFTRCIAPRRRAPLLFQSE